MKLVLKKDNLIKIHHSESFDQKFIEEKLKEFMEEHNIDECEYHIDGKAYLTEVDTLPESLGALFG